MVCYTDPNIWFPGRPSARMTFIVKRVQRASRSRAAGLSRLLFLVKEAERQRDRTRADDHRTRAAKVAG